LRYEATLTIDGMNYTQGPIACMASIVATWWAAKKIPYLQADVIPGLAPGSLFHEEVLRRFSLSIHSVP
jgi:hypothetical protein